MAARKVGRLLAHHVQAGKRERRGIRPVPGLEHGWELVGIPGMLSGETRDRRVGAACVKTSRRAGS